MQYVVLIVVDFRAAGNLGRKEGRDRRKKLDERTLGSTVKVLESRVSSIASICTAQHVIVVVILLLVSYKALGVLHQIFRCSLVPPLRAVRFRHIGVRVIILFCNAAIDGFVLNIREEGPGPTTMDHAPSSYDKEKMR